MTLTTIMLLVLIVLLLVLITGWVLGREAPQQPHQFITDPWETEGEHEGIHRRPAEGDTRPLRDPGPLRHIGDQQT